jgi:integrase
MMVGSMRQRGRGTWELRVYIGVDPDTRQRRYATRTVHGTRRAATVAMAELVEEATHSRLRAGTIGQLLERWMASASPGWSASTVRETRSLMRCHLLPHLGHVPVTKLTAADIDDVYAYLLRRGGLDGRPLSAGTVHRVHVVLHRALTQAVRWEWVWSNPAALASPPRVEPPDIRPPSVEQVRHLLDAVREVHVAFFTYLHLAVMTGARRSQLLAMRWSDVDFDHAAVGFSRALVEGPTGPVLRTTENRRTYRVALDPTSVELLLAHRDRAATRTDGVVDGFVFSSDAGRHPWRPNWVTKRFIAYRRRAGLAVFRLHDLRHFMATTMLAAGVPVPVVSERLCHARTSTTVNIYAHAMPGGDRAAVNLLAELLTPAPDRAAGPPAHTSGRALVP